jgi:hypothetical protein
MLRTANCGGRRMTSENDFEQSSAQRTVNSYGKMKFPPRTVTVISSIGFLLDPDEGGGGLYVRSGFRCVKVSTHMNIAPTLRMSGAYPPLLRKSQ